MLVPEQERPGIACAGNEADDAKAGSSGGQALIGTMLDMLLSREQGDSAGATTSSAR